ncbi:MAG: NAD(P)H-dependent glycerol-3-phosphate dehydrogenase [Planctomycetota bacterium]|jgi:glycerol-3-phosphate dehydrogenase (NAD(P)+)
MSIVIIGSGNWGSTLAGLINPAQPVRLWCETPELIESAGKALKNKSCLKRKKPIEVEIAFSSPLTENDIVVLAVPSSQVAAVTERLRESTQPPRPTIVNASKGLERATFRTMSQVISTILPEATVAVLSGPNIAKEIAAGRPAKAMLGCEDVNTLLKVAKALRSQRLHLDMTRDTVDLELCAAMKGVFAIGAGVIAQRNMGCNFMGLLFTFGLREISNIAKFLGISTDHVFGIAGLGDLVATCFSPDSRNYRLGQLLARGMPLKEASKKVGMVIEGAMTAKAVSEMAALRLSLPLFAAIAAFVEDPCNKSFKRFEQTLLDYPGNG